MDNIYIEDLMEFGLSEKEARVYLTLLELEVANASEIANYARVNRSSTYVVLDSLKKQGLVSTSEENNVQIYTAASPEVLLKYAEDRARQHEGVRNRINNILPELKALHKDTKQKPRVRVFEGKEGLMTALTEALTTEEGVIRASNSGGKIMEVFPEFLIDWAEKRIKLGIKALGIYVDNENTRSIVGSRDDLKQLYKVAFVPKEKHPLPIDLMISGNKVGYLTGGKNELVTIIIENEETANSMKGLFDLAFEEAKRIGDCQDTIK